MEEVKERRSERVKRRSWLFTLKEQFRAKRL